MLLARFLQSREGGVAPVLAIAALPLFGFIGAAIDFGRAASVRSAMQSALDATALMLAKNAQSVDGTQLSAQAKNYLEANFSSTEVQNLAVEAATSASTGTTKMTLTATGTVKTKLAGMIGFSNLNVAVHSEAVAKTDTLGCVLSISETASGAIAGQGSTSVNLSGCSLYDNSSSSTALTMGGSARLSALSVGV